MPLLWVVLAIMFAAATVFNSEQISRTRNTVNSEVVAVSGSVLLYRNIVAIYADAHSTTTGTVSDISLNLPSWYVKPPSLSNYVIAGKSYVFFSDPLPGLVGELARRTESTNVGTNQGGILLTPNKASSGIVLPAQVPTGSVVLIQ